MRDSKRPHMLDKELINKMSLILIHIMRKIGEAIIVIHLRKLSLLEMMATTHLQGLLELIQEHAHLHLDNHNHIMRVMRK